VERPNGFWPRAARGIGGGGLDFQLKLAVRKGKRRVVIYGLTEPDATLTIAGRTVNFALMIVQLPICPS